jgi:hypothetical protein
LSYTSPVGKSLPTLYENMVISAREGKQEDTAQTMKYNQLKDMPII